MDYVDALSELCCNCEVCLDQFASVTRITALSSDPDYIYVKDNGSLKEIEWMDSETFDSLKEKCVKLLQKYGDMRWNQETRILLVIYIQLLKAEACGAVEIIHSDDILNNNSC